MIQPNPPPSFYSTDQAGPSSEPLHPRTPSFDNSIYTPNHSSPTTPYLELQTPVQLPNKAKPQRLAASMDVESATEEVEGDVMKASAPRSSSAIGVGLGLGMKESNQPTSVEANHFQGHQASSPISMSTTVHRSRSESTDSSEGSLDPAELPSPDELQKMLLRVAELEKTASEDWLESAHSAELAVMLRRILTPATVQLPILLKQVEAQRETIKTLQQQAKLSDQMNRVERDRHMAEKASWHAETRALDIVREREIAAGTRPKGVWDMDVGYHQELEAANKRLEMDNRLMAPRLADTQGQIDKLVHELRHLRSQVLLQTGTMAADSQRVHTTQVNKSTAPAPSRSSANRANHALMGDARTEHLLLAARKVRSMRENDERVGKLTLEELKRGGVVGPDGGLGYSEGYGGVMDDESDELEEISEEEEKPTVQSRRNSVRGKGKNATPLLPRAKRTGKKDPSGPTTPRARRISISARVAPPTTTPGGGNFSDLLRAAEMATRPGSPSPDARASTVMSAPRLPLGDDNLTERGSPVKRARRQPPTPTGGWEPGHARRGSRFEGEESNERGAEEDEASALDLLVEASQLDFAQSQGASQDEGPSSQVSSAARFGGLLGVGEQTTGGQSPKSSSGESALGPAIDLRFNSNGNRLGNHGESRSHVRPTGLELDGTQIHSQHSTSAHKTPKKPRPRAASNAGVADIHTPARMYHNPHDASRTLPPTFDTPANSQDRDYGATPMTSISQMSPPSSINRRNVIMGDDLPPGAYNSPTGGTVPGLGKYVHLTSSMPARRMRSPYLKWTEEEDELLARAVAMHGEKWDLVSKGVPTRSYHQVRQRWLRKTGAFDKKTAMSTEPTTGSALKTDPAEDDDDGSPTPAGGATPTGKKRKMMDEGQ